MYLSKKAITSFILLFIIGNVLAQTDTIAKKRTWLGKLHPDSLTNLNLKWVPLPVISSSPETGINVGIVGTYFINSGHNRDTTTRESFASFEVKYSTRNQVTVESYAQLYTKGEKYFVRNVIGYSDYNERIWGFGNETVPNDKYEKVDYSRWYWQANVAKQLKNKFFVGLNTDFSKTYNVDQTSDNPHLINSESGEYGSRVVGIGPLILWDKRDHLLTPEKGWYGELSINVHDNFLGSEYDYIKYNVDLRKYFPLNGNRCIAFQGVANLSSGTVPWREQSKLGGGTIMRGYFAGRYRDNQFMAAQTEFRTPVHKWFNLAIFGSVGEVADKLNEFSVDNLRFAGGGGIRILANKKKNVYFRIDYAVSSDKTSGFYLKLGEAF